MDNLNKKLLRFSSGRVLLPRKEMKVILIEWGYLIGGVIKDVNDNLCLVEFRGRIDKMEWVDKKNLYRARKKRIIGIFKLN